MGGVENGVRLKEGMSRENVCENLKLHENTLLVFEMLFELMTGDVSMMRDARALDLGKRGKNGNKNRK
jgi:hypothetical protein